LKIHGSYLDRVAFIDNPDWRFSIEYCITHAEAVVGIIIACIPTLRGLITPKNFDTPSLDSRWPSGTYNSSYMSGFSRTRRIIAAYSEQDVIPIPEKEADEESRSSSMSELAAQASPRHGQRQSGGLNPNHHTFQPTPPLPLVGKD
jgi:hypothetical protein